MNYKIYQLLKASDRARNKDVTTFKKWEENKISLDEALEEFRNNNNVDERIKIEKGNFRNWLNSLGYIRYEED